MAIQITVTGFTGAYAHHNCAQMTHPVGMSELVHRAITVGGIGRGSPLAKSYRRSSIANLVLCAVNAAGPQTPSTNLQTTTLYRSMETSEKSGASFRLGMALASIAASRVLDLPALTHGAATGISGSGRRADLFGIDKFGAYHVVEAKARSHGMPYQVLTDGKNQALTTQIHHLPSAATASVSASDLSGVPISVHLHDPPIDGDDPKPVDEAAIRRVFYSPVVELLEVRPPAPSGWAAVDQVATGAWLPGSTVWIGLRDTTRAALQEPDPPKLLRGDEPLQVKPTNIDPWLVSESADGHIVVLGPSPSALETVV